MTTETVVAVHPPSSRSSLSKRILIGLLAGVATGIFFGERTAVLQPFADAFIKLLQMTVLPYVTISIVGGIGALSLREARTLSLRLGAVLVLLWAVAFAALFLFPLMFPYQQNASFFSSALLEDRERFDIVGLYIPSNPFNSLANNVVPAVVLFSIVVGIALITIAEKARLLEVLATLNAAISKATAFVVELTPYGVFVLGAVVVGTIGFAELRRLQVYMLSYAAMTLLLSLWVLPGLVTALTPIPYRALMSKAKDALLLGFMTTSLFAVLPMLTEAVKQLLREHVRLSEHDAATPEVIVPVSFNFPHTGKIAALSFVLFAAWFSNTALGAGAYPKLAMTGLLTTFGSVNAAIPFLLDLFRIPADMFQLFITSGMLNARFGTLVSAVHTLTVAVLGTCAMTGALVVNPRKLTRYLVVTAVLTIATVGGVRILLQYVVDTQYTKDQVLTGMEATRDRGPMRVYKSTAEAPPLPPPDVSVLDRIEHRRALRVGYFEDSLPFVFTNRRGALVGFDVEMATQLARDLDAVPEFVPIARTVLDRGLDASQCDIVMSGAAVTTKRTLDVLMSNAYLDETIAFVVPDHLAATFSEWDSIRALRSLRVGVPPAPYYVTKLQAELPGATLVPMRTVDEMFAPHDPPIDAFLLTAERGSAYTLLHPEYSVAVPKPRPFKVPLAYAIAGRDQALAAVVNTWIELKRKDGTIDELFAHWILGKNSAPIEPRWSVVRNVLHWGK